MRKQIAIAGAVIIGLAAAGYLVLGYWRATVVVAVPMRGPAVEAVYATGTVEPVSWAKVAPKATGRITEILKREGDKVRPGMLLARLDDREARANVGAIAERVDFLRAEYARQDKLFRAGYATRQSYERADSELKQAEAQMAAARQVLADKQLVAPLSGTVLRRDGEPGEVATAGQVLYWVGEAGKLWVVAEVDEENIPRVRVGQRVLLRADAYPERVLEGQIASVTPKGDPINKSYRARVDLPPGTPLQIGMTVEVNIVVREEQQALLVPAGAVVNGHVWVVRDGRASRIKVEAGVKGNNHVAIRSGLNGDELVIVQPPANLTEGKALRSRRAP
jgi:RND family efflux transporter MFP subunit